LRWCDSALNEAHRKGEKEKPPEFSGSNKALVWRLAQTQSNQAAKIKMKKTKIKQLFILLSFLAGLQHLTAQTAFTYQGRLNDNGQPANGTYDFQFRLYDAEVGGAQVPTVPVAAGVTVSNGLFTTTIDFGDGVFDGTTYWLEIAVQPMNGGGFVTLDPRQPITPAPQAIYAATVSASGISGTYNTAVNFSNASNTFAGAFSGEGSGLENLDASNLTSGTVPDAQLSGTVARTNQVWLLNGNSGVAGGQFLGTLDDQPLELRTGTNGMLRLEPTADSPNVIGGSRANSVDSGIQGATIAGGGLMSYPNKIAANFATIGGGTFGAVDGQWGTIGGGRDNRVHAESATVAGGFRNTIASNSLFSVIAGGQNNVISSNSSGIFIGGGFSNSISNNSTYSTISGGYFNGVGTVGGTIGGGYNNSILSGATYSIIGGGALNVISNDTHYAVVAGGFQNILGTNSSYSTIGGGKYNRTGAEESTVAGGALNNALGFSSTIGGGGGNRVEGVWSVIAGGRDSVINSNGVYSAIGGGRNNSIESEGGYSTISGGEANSINGQHGTISGGSFNTLQTNGYGVIAGGALNTIQKDADCAAIGGGYNNTISVAKDYASIHGGFQNVADAIAATVGGGIRNVASGYGATIGGGGNTSDEGNTAAGDWSTIGGGRDNSASGIHATIPGGNENDASGNNSFAAGSRAKAIHQGAFVWGDSSLGNIISTTDNSVTMRASGGYRLFSNSGATVGVTLASGSGSWTTLSDRNAKENFESVDGTEVLDRLAKIPIQTWNYKSQDDSIRHLGPMAQDFKAAFDVGETDTGISAVDADGVALAAIQGLNQKLQQKETEITELKARLEKLEQIINQQNGGAR
jgi:hypothetical protein